MATRSDRKISFLGNFPPRQCGIATFTRDIRAAVAEQRPEWQTPVLSVTDPGFRYAYPEVVRFELPERNLSSYQRAADFINLSHTDLLCRRGRRWRSRSRSSTGRWSPRCCLPDAPARR